MRIQELLSEAISLTKYQTDFRQAIKHAIVDSLKEFKRLRDVREFRDLRSTIDDQVSMRPIWQKLAANFYLQLDRYLVKRLQDVTEQLYPGSYVPIKFVKTNDQGYARGLNIYLSDEFLINISKIILNKYYDSAASSLTDFSFYDHFFSQYNNEHLIWRVISYADQVIEDLLDVLIHELVHVVQHSNQLQKGKTNYEYRSLLSDPKKKKFDDSEFIRLSKMRFKYGRLPVNAETRYRLLHAASPQEIGAYSHNIAQEVILAYGLDDPNLVPADIPPLSEFGSIIASIVKKYIKPVTHEEHRVFQRYAKAATLEVSRYIDHLRKTVKS